MDGDAVKLTSWGLYLNAPEPVLICTTCRYALQPSGDTVNKHLWEKHSIPTSARRGVGALLRTLRLSDPNTIAARADRSLPHPHLITHQGVTCRHCPYRSTSVELVGRHLSKTHGIRGYKDSATRDHLDDSIWLQSWTQNGSRVYWTVQAPTAGDGGTEEDVHGTPKRRQWLEALHRGEQDRIAQVARNRPLSDMGGDDLSVTSNWMRRTDWANTFRQANRPLLRRMALAPSIHSVAFAIGEAGGQLVISPASDEQRLLLIGHALDAFFDRCEDTVAHTDVPLRCWLRGYFPDKPYTFPFQVPGRLSTRLRYRNLWKQLTYFAVRLWRLDSATRHRLIGFEVPTLWTEPIRRLWQDSWWAAPGATELLRSMPKRVCEPQDEDQYGTESESSEDGNDSDDDNDGDYTQSGDTDGGYNDHRREDRSTNRRIMLNSAALPALEQLGDLTGVLAAAICQEEFRDGRAASTLAVYFSGVLGLSPDGHTFQRPTNYTSKLAALIYCMRLTLLEATLPRQAHSYIGWPVRPAKGQLADLQRVRRQFLCWGCQAPMGELLALLSYGRSISRTDGPTFRVRWSDDGAYVSWADGRVSMGQFRQLGKTVLKDANLSCKHLMYGVHSSVRIEAITDDMAVNRAGYSFLSDARNGLQTAHLDLSKRACLNPLDGLMSHGRWNIPAVNGYLHREREFVRQLMLLMYTFGGQAPRSTELFSIELENGPGTSRGIYVHGGSMVYVTRHTKARRTTNREFQVARYLPREVSELLLIYLVYIRRFAEMLRRNCLGFKEGSRLLFYTPGLEGTLWTSAALSKVLRSYTTDALGHAIGVQTYRQLSIAITERHVRQISKPFDRYCDKGRDKDLEVAFAWQSGHRPLLRGTIYGLDAAYPDSLQPSLLRIYEWASSEWHRFLQIGTHLDSDITRSPSERPPLVEVQATDGREGSGDLKRKALCDDVLRSPSSKRARLGTPTADTLGWKTSKHATEEERLRMEDIDDPNRTVADPRDEPTTSAVRVSECGRVAYAADYKVVICIPCGHCMKPPPHARRHFQDMHSNWPLRVRKALANHIDELCLVEPETLTYSRDCVRPIPHLPIFDGYHSGNAASDNTSKRPEIALRFGILLFM